MNTESEILLENSKDNIGCSAVGSKEVNVSVPITIKAFGEVGNARTRCLGRAVISTATDTPLGKVGEVCKFTISQKLRVDVPVIFGARAEAGEASIDCGSGLGSCSSCG